MAVELELSIKSNERLRRILDGYLVSDFLEVRFLVGPPTLELRLRGMADQAAAPYAWLKASTLTRVVIERWRGSV